MKKIVIVALLSIAYTLTLSAQKNNFIKDINVGAIFSTTASTTFSGGSKPFEVDYGLSTSVAFITDKTVHNFMYNFGGNSIAMLNGYFLPKDWDVYVVGAKSLNTKNGYLGIGIEKMEKVGNVKIFEFCELGTGFQGKPILSIGVLMNLSWSLKKK